MYVRNAPSPRSKHYVWHFSLSHVHTALCNLGASEAALRDEDYFAKLFEDRLEAAAESKANRTKKAMTPPKRYEGSKTTTCRKKLSKFISL